MRRQVYLRWKTTNARDNNTKETAKGSKGNTENQKILGSNTRIHSLRTQTYFRLSLVSAGGDKRQPEIGLRSQAKEYKAMT